MPPKRKATTPKAAGNKKVDAKNMAVTYSVYSEEEESRNVAFVKGFKRPSPQQALAALWDVPAVCPNPLLPHERCWLTQESQDVVPSPRSPDDWLAQYRETVRHHQQYCTNY